MCSWEVSLSENHLQTNIQWRDEILETSTLHIQYMEYLFKNMYINFKKQMEVIFLGGDSLFKNKKKSFIHNVLFMR